MLPSPPDAELPPALAGALLGQKSCLVSSTLFDLARRGMIQIREEIPSSDPRQRDFVIQRKSYLGKLYAHEQDLLDTLFKKTITLRASQVPVKVRPSRLDQLVNKELYQRGWMNPPNYLGIIKVIPFLGLGFTCLGYFISPELSIGGFLVALIAAIVMSKFLSPSLSVEGKEQAKRWEQFRSYLKQVTERRSPALPSERI